MRLTLSAAALLAAILAGLCPRPAAAQCEPQLISAPPLVGTSHTISAVLVQPGGDIIVSGIFSYAGNVIAEGIARFDGTAWHAIEGAPLKAWELAGAPNGDVIAAGWYTPGGTQYVFRWDGAQWHELGDGSEGYIARVAVMQSGEVVMGGRDLFDPATGKQFIARWDGSAWLPLGDGIDDGRVHSLAALSDGSLIAGGTFKTIGGMTVNGIARWDGTAWSPLGTGLTREPPFSQQLAVTAIAELPGGDIIARGLFSHAGGVPVDNFARWDGTAWHPFASRVWASSLAVLPGGEVVAAGSFSAVGGVSANNIAMWTGSSWVPLGDGTDSWINQVVVTPAGDLLVVGAFTGAGGISALRIARWDGQTWSRINEGVGGGIAALQVTPNGNLAAAGTLSTIDGVDLRHIAQWNGTTWVPWGSGTISRLTSIAIIPGVASMVGTRYTYPGGQAHSGSVLRQTTIGGWSRMGSSFNGHVNELAVLPGGRLIVAGNFTETATGVTLNRIARWSGSEWVSLGVGLSSNVYTLAVLPGGDLIAGGHFTSAGGIAANYVARWDGSAWSAIGTGVPRSVSDLHIRANGNIVAASQFGTLEWDGQYWWILGASRTYRVIELPDGRLLLAGEHDIDGSMHTGLATYHDATETWAAFGPPAHGSWQVASDMVTLPGGELVIAGGVFDMGDGTVAFGPSFWECVEPAHCYADCDRSGSLNVADFLCFIDEYSIASTLPVQEQIPHYANCDGSTQPPVLSISDFLCFIDQFSLGCP